MNRLTSKFSMLVIPLFLIVIHPQNSYGQSDGCISAQSDAKDSASELEIKTLKFKSCVSDEGASELERRAQELQRCAGNMEFSDDCFSEFKEVQREYSNFEEDQREYSDVCYKEYEKTKRAFSNYENAVSDVSSYCE